MALNSHLQRYRHAVESDPIPRPREEQQASHEISTDGDRDQLQSKLKEAIYVACHKINCADLKGEKLLPKLLLNEKAAKRNGLYPPHTKNKIAYYCLFLYANYGFLYIK